MSDAAVKIEKLRIRAGAMSRPEALRLGEAVAQRLAEQTRRPAQPQKIDLLRVRVRAPESSRAAGLADVIARQIVRRMP